MWAGPPSTSVALCNRALSERYARPAEPALLSPHCTSHGQARNAAPLAPVASCPGRCSPPQIPLPGPGAGESGAAVGGARSAGHRGCGWHDRRALLGQSNTCSPQPMCGRACPNDSDSLLAIRRRSWTLGARTTPTRELPIPTSIALKWNCPHLASSSAQPAGVGRGGSQSGPRSRCGSGSVVGVGAGSCGSSWQGLN